MKANKYILFKRTDSSLPPPASLNGEICAFPFLEQNNETPSGRMDTTHYDVNWLCIQKALEKLRTSPYCLNVTEQAVHACVHPPYYDPPGVSAYCRLPSPSAAERCIEWCKCRGVSVCVDRLLPSRLSSYSIMGVTPRPLVNHP